MVKKKEVEEGFESRLSKGGQCPRCTSTLFHVEQKGRTVVIKCYRTNMCGWEMKVKL